MLSTTDGKREVRDLSLSLGENRIAGDLVLDENFLPLGTVDFQLPDISPLAALALQTAEGDLNGTATFSEQDGKPQLAVEAQTQALSRGDVTAKDVDISATINDYIDAPAVTGKIRAKTVTSGSTVVQDVDVTLDQDGAWTGFDGGATVSDIPARASGRLKLADGKTTIELQLGPGDGARRAGQAGAALDRGNRRRHDDAGQAGARHRRRQRDRSPARRARRSTSTPPFRAFRPRSPTPSLRDCRRQARSPARPR